MYKRQIYNNEEVVNDKIINTAYENETKIDNYGKILSQTNKKNSVDSGTTVLFNYQSANESESVAKVTQIVDPYEKVTYDYIYDDENRPSGYRVKSNSSNNKEMQDVYKRQAILETTEATILFDGSSAMHNSVSIEVSEAVRISVENNYPEYFSVSAPRCV